MTSLVLIPWPETTWSAEGRIGGRTPVPLSDAGRHQAEGWGSHLAEAGLRVVYSGGERASTETAEIVAERSNTRHKVLPELAEVDSGLWNGLTVEELKHRYAKVYKRWCEDPSSVCPPEGEGLDQACERLRDSLARLKRKHGDSSVALVLGPVAFGVARSVLEVAGLADVRNLMHQEPLCYSHSGSGRTEEAVRPTAACGEDASVTAVASDVPVVDGEQHGR